MSPVLCLVQTNGLRNGSCCHYYKDDNDNNIDDDDDDEWSTRVKLWMVLWTKTKAFRFGA